VVHPVLRQLRATSWLPTIYTGTYHVELGSALNLSLLSTFAGFLGCVLAAVGVHRVGRRGVLLAGMTGAGAALHLLAALGASDTAEVAVLTTVAALCGLAAKITLYLYSPELFPSHPGARDERWRCVHRVG